MSLEGQSNLNCTRTAADKKRQSGQLVLEYILLMILAVGLSTLIKNQFIGGNADDPESAGIMTKFVYKITLPIAADTPSE